MEPSGLLASFRSLLLALGAAAGGIAVAIGLSLVAALLVATLGIDLDVITAVVLTLALTAGIGFGGVSLLYVRVRGLDRSFIEVRVPSPSDLAWVGTGYVLAFVSVIAASMFVGSVGGEAAPNQLSQLGLETPELLLLLVPASLLLIGPGEELLFRGVVQGTLRESFSAPIAVGLASAIFASVHFVALTGGVGARLTTIGILFFPSVVFGAAYERTGNLVVPALIHGLYNSTLAVLLYVVIRVGGGSPPAAVVW